MGGGKSGGSGYTPVEQPDSLKSRQRAQIVDLVCEGPIEGPVDGLESVMFNDTPLENSDGSFNFSGVEIEWRQGHQVQDPLPGHAAAETEVAVSTEVKFDNPLVRTVTNTEVDRVRVMVGVPALVEITERGDRIESEVRLAIEVGAAGVWTDYKAVTISGKTTAPYTESHEVYAPAAGVPWQIRVTRLSEDSTTDRLQNKTVWYSYTELIDAQLTYPNSVVVGLRFDSEQFQSIPRRNYHIRGLIVRVPANYDPDTRAYTGIWDGSFKLAWTNNPAWVLFDILTNTRYGMGRALVGFEPDKWRLYEIAQYCDELVDDGFGGQEPRFTTNLYIADQRAAYEVVNNLASVFRGMPVWDGLQISVNQDRPQDPVWQFNNSNVAEGKFSYQSSARKARHTAVQVEYLDAANGWEKGYEYVQDDDQVARYGLNLQKVTAFGCTSRGQAHRVGQWLLITEKLERQSISFDVGREGLVCLPGDVIEVVDNQYAGARLGGRVLATDDQTVTLDAPVTLTAGQANWLHYLDASSQLQQLQIISPAEGDTATLVLSAAPVGLRPLDTFNLSAASLTPRLWRVLGVTENRDAGTYTLAALQHVPEKHAIIEDGLVFDPPTSALAAGALPPVENLVADLLPESDAAQVRLTWTTPRVLVGVRFDVKILLADRVVVRTTETATDYFVRDIAQGEYSVEVRAISAQGQLGPVATLSFAVAPPVAPDALQLIPSNFGVTVRPLFSNGANSLGTTYEFFGGADQAEVEAQTQYLGRGFILDQQGLKPDTEYWYGVVAVNAVGRSGLTLGSVQTLLDPTDLLQVIGPQIPALDWAVQLQELVDSNSSGLVTLSDRAALVVNAQGRISGVTITAESEASAVDFLADFVSFTDPDTLERNLYWDNARKTLVIKGELQLLDGKTVSTEADIRALDGADGSSGAGIYRLDNGSGVFPSDTGTANSLFSSYVGRGPVQDDVLTVYATNGSGVVTDTASRMYDGNAWVSPTLLVDGDIIAQGTLRGDRLIAGTEIIAPVINAGEVIGSRVVTAEGTGPRVELDPASDWPLWVGSGNKTLENAQIAVDDAGNLTVREALSVPDASIDTLKLAGQAVTFSIASQVVETLAVPTAGVQVASLAFTTDDSSRLELKFNAQVEVDDNSSSRVGHASAEFLILDNTGAVHTTLYPMMRVATAVISTTTSTVALVAQVVLPAGSWTAQVNMKNSATDYGNYAPYVKASYRTLNLLELKR